MSASQHYDVAIIGTGPAGGMAAVRLAQSGARIIILERDPLPRIKACGGALSKGPVEALLDWDFSDHVSARSGTIRSLLDHDREIIRHRDSPILFVDRAEFDFHLIDRALAIAPSTTELRTDYCVNGLEFHTDHVQIFAKTGGSLRAHYVIAADGAGGPCRRLMGLKRAVRMAPAIDVEIELEQDIWANERDRVTFNYGCLPGGYGWSFPKNGHLSCGVLSWTRSPGIREALNDYLSKSFPSGTIRSVRQLGHPIPAFHGPEPISKGRVLLTGDAANLVDPYLGEGIRYALQSGQIASEFCLKALETGPTGLHGYDDAIYASIGSKLATIATIIKPLFIKSPPLFYKTFIERGGSMTALMNTLSNETVYEPY